MKFKSRNPEGLFLVFKIFSLEFLRTETILQLRVPSLFFLAWTFLIKKLAQLLKLEPISLTKELHTGYEINNLNELGKVVDPSPIYSLMFYLGTLTHTENSRVRNPELKITNLVSEEDFIERLKKIFDPKNSLGLICSEWLKTKNIQPLCEYLSKEIFSGFQNADVTGGELAFSSSKGSGIL